MADLNEIAHRIAPRLAGWLQKLAKVVQERKRVKDSPYTPTKVAILDNGILSVSPISYDVTRDTAVENSNGDQSVDSSSVWSRIREGRSFVDQDSRLSPWLFASDPHGTQMANLICAIDPFCEIYVARVAEDSFGITPERVAKAINWARSKKVDVISMSLITGDSNQILLDAIQRASNDDIVMTCSTHDEGLRIVDAYPASYIGSSLSLIVLAACDEYGKLLRDVDDSKYHYMLRGQDIAAGIIPFLKSKDTISGSSVSTALAAGLCSLILTCDRLAHPKKVYASGTRGSSRFSKVKEHLDLMRSSEKSKFVLLEKFGQIDKPPIGQVFPDGTGGPSAKNVLRYRFGMES
ncbi:subtilisin-like protein [Biscogniauxia mediterranea]|nr:subtilisin-like protein [Biscogniauxia mediterranea]